MVKIGATQYEIEKIIELLSFFDVLCLKSV